MQNPLSTGDARQPAIVQCPPQLPRGPQKWNMHEKAVCLARGPTVILGDPQRKGDKIRSSYLTPTFSGAHKWTEMLRQPLCIRGFIEVPMFFNNQL